MNQPVRLTGEAPFEDLSDQIDFPCFDVPIINAGYHRE